MPEILFWTPHVELFNFDPPDSGGYLTPPPRYVKYYVTINTGDGKEFSPPPIQNRTQGTVQSLPHLLYKVERRGLFRAAPPLLYKTNAGEGGRKPTPFLLETRPSIVLKFYWAAIYRPQLRTA